MFFNFSKTEIIICAPFDLSSADALNLDESITSSLGRVTMTISHLNGNLSDIIKYLPDYKISHLSKQKAFAEDNLRVTQLIKFVLHMRELEQEKMLSITSIISLSHNVLKKVSVSGLF